MTQAQRKSFSGKPALAGDRSSITEVRRQSWKSTRDLRCGERIIAEAPLARWTIGKNEASEARLRSFAQVVAAMSAEQRASFLALSRAEHHRADGHGGANGDG